MSLCLVLPNITIYDGKADCADVAQRYLVFKIQVYHYMLLAHVHSDIIK